MNRDRETPILWDLERTRFDLSPEEAFRLTEVRSLEGYRRLKQSLPELRGSSYLFINVLDDTARLVLTIIVAEDGEVTTFYSLDHISLGIGYDEIVRAARISSLEDGNYPISSAIERKIRIAAGTTRLRRMGK